MTFFGLLAFLASLMNFGPDRRDAALVERLGSEEWSERRDADHLLRLRGLKAARALRRGMDSEDAEVRRSCQALYDRARHEGVAALGPMPMLDALWYDTTGPEPGYRHDHTPEFRACYDYFSPYLDQVGRDGMPYRNYYLATQLAVWDLVEAGVPPEMLRPIMVEMRRRDAVFLHGLGYMPPAD